VAPLQVAGSVAIGSSGVCLHGSAGRALAAGATKDEIADVLLAIILVAGLNRIVSAAPPVATGLDYDVEAVLGGTRRSLTVPQPGMPPSSSSTCAVPKSGVSR
jgi:hypothetical protein